MKYLKFYENFIEDEVEIDYKKELSDKTIDDVLSDNFFDEQKDSGSYIDSNGIGHIKKWFVY
jgi:hypothetical protein